MLILINQGWDILPMTSSGESFVVANLNPSTFFLKSSLTRTILTKIRAEISLDTSSLENPETFLKLIIQFLHIQFNPRCAASHVVQLARVHLDNLYVIHPNGSVTSILERLQKIARIALAGIGSRSFFGGLEDKPRRQPHRPRQWFLSLHEGLSHGFYNLLKLRCLSRSVGPPFANSRSLLHDWNDEKCHLNHG